MDFGKVDEKELGKIDFTLPVDGEFTKHTLSGKKVKSNSFYVGCAKWGRKEWIEMIYPAKTKDKDFLKEYAKQFNSIELNAVFYSIPKEAQIIKWKEMVAANKDFIFCPKISRTISHIKRLKNATAETDWYLKAITAFGKHLGPAFLQLGDNFGPKNIGVIDEYLNTLPKEFNLFLEVRHVDFFKDKEANHELFTVLKKHHIGAAITDTSGRRDCLHMELTTPKAFIRFVGNGWNKFRDADKSRIDDWVERLKKWLDNGLEDVYFFLHQHDESDTPYIADYTVEQFNKHLGSDLSRVNFISKNNLLF